MTSPPPLAWRRATSRDARALCHLGRATYLATAAVDHSGEALLDYLDEAHDEAQYRAWLADPACALLIGETPGGAPAGYAMLAPPDPPQGGDIELKRFYLLAPWHGHGAADEMMAQMLIAALSQHATRVTLAVFEGNVRARRFYERHLFTPIGIRPSWLVPGADLILYVRTLDACDPSGQNRGEPLAG